MADNRINVVGTNIAEKATMIWNVADMLRGPFKPHEYGLVILPMTVIKRFHDCLLPTWQNVQDTYEKVKRFAVMRIGFPPCINKGLEFLFPHSCFNSPHGF